MNSEILYVNDHPRPHWVVPIPGDGSCLFHSLSFSMNGHIGSSYEIRLAIAEYVVAHWDDLQIYTCDEHGDPYLNAHLYKTAMVRTATYGSAAELKAAAALYPYAFEVYENGRLRGSFGDYGHPVRRLRFSGSFIGGHYEVLLPKMLSNSEDMDESHKNAIENGGRSQKIAIDKEIKEEAACDCQNNPENRMEILPSYNLLYPKVYGAPIATVSYPEVYRKVLPLYKRLHPKLNLESIQRKKLDKKRKSQALTNKIKSRLEADKLIIWAIGYRQRTLEYFYKTIDKLKTTFKISLEKLRSCPPDRSLKEGLESFLGKSEHISTHEPQEVYNFIQNKEKAIEVNDTKKEVFGNVKKHGHYLAWSCSDLCAMDEDIIRQLTNVFETLVNKSAVQFYVLIEKENLIEYLNYIYYHQPHFPRLRTISKEMFKLQSIFNILKDVDVSLQKLLHRKNMEHQMLTTLL